MFKKDNRKNTKKALAAQRWLIMAEAGIFWVYDNVNTLTRVMTDTILPALVELFGPKSAIGSALAGILTLMQDLNPNLVPIPLYLYA